METPFLQEPSHELSTSSARVLFFSVLRERLGRGSIEVNIPEGARAGDVLDDLARRYPALNRYRSSIRVAVNQCYVDENHPVQDGDEIALITPVSGG